MSRWPQPVFPLLLLTLGCWAIADAHAELKAQLHHNPFQRPHLEPPQDAAATNAGEPTPVERPAPVLQATLLGSHTPLARINGKIVAAGEAVDGYTVQAITVGGATLIQAGQVLHLRLTPNASVVPTAPNGAPPPTAISRSRNEPSE